MGPKPFICTAEHPWVPETKNWLVLHPDAKKGEQQDGWPAGDYVPMRCPHCGHEWKKELPQ
jgi:hypothetical protein